MRKILATIRSILFGYDFFISYGQEDTSLLFVKRLEEKLTLRDFAVFRDESVILAGDRLSFVIRLAIRRTRTLVLVGTERAVGSAWVLRELSTFRSRRRTPIAIDLEKIRERSAWGALEPFLGDTLVLSDVCEGPSDQIVDAIARSHRGRRTNQLARLTLVAISGVLACLAMAAILTASQLSKRTEMLRREAIISSARSLADPVTQLLVLSELPKDALDYRVDAIVRNAVRKSLPAFVVRDVPSSFRDVKFSLDNKGLICLDYDGALWFCPLEGGKRRLIAKTGETSPCAVQVMSNEGAAYISGQRDLTFCSGTGQVTKLTFEEKQASPKTALGPDRATQGMSGDTPWRIAAKPSVAFALQSRSIQVFDLNNRRQIAEFDLGGRSPLDLRAEESSPGSWSATFLCTDGTVWHISKPIRSPALFGRLAGPGKSVHLPENADGASRAFSLTGNFAVALVDEIASSSLKRVLNATALDLSTKKVVQYPLQDEVDSWKVSDSGGQVLALPKMAPKEGGGAHLPRRCVLDLVSAKTSYEPAPMGVVVLSQVDFLNGSRPLNEAVATNLSRAYISPDGGQVVVPGVRSTLLWNVREGTLKELLSKNLVDRLAAFDQSGAFVAVPEFGSIRIWLLSRRTGIDVDCSLPTQVISCDSISPGKLLACCVDGQIFVIDADTGATQPLYSLGLPVKQAFLLADQKRLLVESDKGILEVVNAISGQIRWRADAAFVGALHVNERDDCYLHVPKTGLYRVDLSAGRVTQVVADQHIDEITLSSKSDVVLYDDPGQAVMRLAGGKDQPLYAHQASEHAWALDMSPDGKTFGVGLYGKALIFDDAGVRNVVLRNMTEKEDVDAIAWLQGDALLGTANGRLSKVDSSGRETSFISPELRTSSKGAVQGALAHVGVIYDVIPSPREDMIMTLGGIDSTIRIWDPEGRLLAKISLGDLANLAKFIDDGRRIVYAFGSVVSVRCPRTTDILQAAVKFMRTSLVPSERIRYLGEDEETARASYEVRERSFGREPLQEDALQDVDLSF